MTKSRFKKMPEDRFNRSAVLKRVVDGDTLDVEIDLGWSMTLKERVRLAGVDTPEINNKVEKEAGKWVKSEVAELFKEETPLIITSTAYDRTGNVRGKYGRTMAEVYRLNDGLCLNDYLIQKKWGWPTDDKGSIVGERSLALLKGLPKKLIS